MKALTEELAGVKEKHLKLIERRKERWREDERLTSAFVRTENELRQHERDLASMMDRVRVALVFVFALTELSESRILAQGYAIVIRRGASFSLFQTNSNFNMVQDEMT